MTDALGDAAVGEASGFPAGCTRLALVSAPAVEGNIRSLRDAASGSRLLVDLTANAWGHGLVESARAVVSAGADVIAVSRIEDGVTLRQAGIDGEIVVWNVSTRGARDELALFGLSAAASSPEALLVVLNSGARNVWLNFGMRRDNLAVDRLNLEAYAGALSAAGRGSVVLCAGDARLLRHAADFFTSAGIEVLGVVSRAGRDVTAVGGYPGVVRVGAEAFGLSETLEPAGTRPALSLRAPIIALKNVDGDVGVSYGYTYRTSAATTLALVPLGYGDGVDRSLGNRAEVSLLGERHTIAGRVAMDATVLDVGGRSVRVGDVVEFFGDPAEGAPSAQEYGELLGISSAAVVAGITARVSRRWT